MPAQTTGMFTEPSVALIVPLDEIALLQTGKFISCSVRTSRQQIAEIAVGTVARHARDDHVARADLLGRDVQHPVVARLQQHGDRRTRDARAGIDGPHIRFEQAHLAHGLVHRGRAIVRQRIGHGRIRAGDVAIDNA